MPAIVIPDVALNHETTIPQLGFGVFRVPDHEATPAVAAALEAGYRAIDTAAYYRNEPGTAAAIAASGLPREQLHITTKVWRTDLGYDATLAALDKSLANLKFDYLDLYLIHWPVPSRQVRRNLARTGEDQRRRPHPLHRRGQLPAGPAGAAVR